LAGKKRKGTELAVFKGKKAELTHAMLRALSKQALVKYDLHKTVTSQGFKDTHYGTIKKKIELLEETGYLKKASRRKTQPGSEGILYEATFKALAALKLKETDLDDLFRRMDESTALDLLALLARIPPEKNQGKVGTSFLRFITS
jgi:DNA-binding PadR family transcriptional regulator